MFFEGSEKKAEIIIDSNQFSLFDQFDDTFWQVLVAQCNAQILSSIENKHIKAYILSESSLFVWRDRVVILTCGITALVHSVKFLLDNLPNEIIQRVIYQRKNEYFAHAQLTSFDEDCKTLAQQLDGTAYRFGEMDSHHNYIFHYQNNEESTTAKVDNSTYELLAYQISNAASLALTAHKLNKQDVRDFFHLETLLPGFTLDDFVFTPYGYSLNALKNEQYFTIHVTPQVNSSYVSFQSNINLIEMAPRILQILQPTSFDLLSFNDDDFDRQINTHISRDYVRKSLVKGSLPPESPVYFATFIAPQSQYSTPEKLNIFDDLHGL